MRPRSSGLAQSVHARLLARARHAGTPFAELLETYAIERFLHRLGRSSLRQRYVLKGALMLRQWIPQAARFTRDVDLVASNPLDGEELEGHVRALLGAETEPDGLDFDSGELEIQPIRPGSDVVGYRVRFDVFLGRSRVRFQLDVGVGDSLYPDALETEIPSLLDLPVAPVRGVSPYTAISEKVEAILVLGTANSRMKDYFDLDELSGRLNLDGSILREAMKRTLARRGTEPPSETPAGFSEVFARDALTTARWEGFRTRVRSANAETSFEDVVARVRAFALPPLRALSEERDFDARWPEGGPWSPAEGMSP